MTAAPAPLSPAQRQWLDRALACVDAGALADLAMRLVDTPSPTGEEGLLAARLTEDLCQRGFDTIYQALDPHRGNCIARLRGDGTGPDLLVYGHLDTTFTGDAREDYAVIGPGDRPDLRPRAARQGDLITGLGISNPKGGVACAIAAADAVRRAGVPLRGDVILGFVAGGIHKVPTEGVLRTYQGRAYQGFGIGCEYMLKHGIRADFALSTKPGYTVVWEEPGQCWFTVQVKGIFCYTGLRHVQPCRSPIVDAARVIEALEKWFPDYTRRHTRGLLAPQAGIGAIEGGWPFKPEFIPGICNLYVDVRTHADTGPLAVKREFAALMDQVRRDHPELTLTWDMTLSVAGSRTDPDSWIVQSSLRAWEALERRAHVPATAMSGTSDGNVLRNWGIPTARLGLPGHVTPEPGWPPNYDACRVGDLERLTRAYVRVIVDTCTRSRDEVASAGRP